jgi:hypothetical protein
MDNKLSYVLGAAVLFFFVFLIGSMVISGIKRDEAIATLAAKGVNPILARCSLDNQYTKDNSTLCAEALKK